MYTKQIHRLCDFTFPSELNKVVHEKRQYWARLGHNSGDILRVDGWLMVLTLAKHPLAEHQANRLNR